MLSRFSSLPEWLSWLETLHPASIDLGLDRISRVASSLNLQQFTCPVVTVAGTNGKGSCVASLSAVYQHAGYRVGVYTSPHLMRFNERIVIEGECVSDDALCEALAIIDEARGDVSLTFFEFTTLAALWLFQRADLDVLLLEVGLGGRLDAVNIVDPDVSVITTIDIDHTEYLGSDRESIAKEKAGIFRFGKPAVCGDLDVPQAILNQAKSMKVSLFCVGRGVGSTDRNMNMSVEEQTHSIVKEVVRLLMDRLPVVQEGLDEVLKAVKLPGRFQIIEGTVQRILDVAHNPQAISMMAKRLKALPCSGRRLAVFSMLRDKDIFTSLQNVMPLIDRWYVAELETPRTMNVDELLSALGKLGVDAGSCFSYLTISDAYRAAMSEAYSGDCVVVFGSFYAVGKVLCDTIVGFSQVFAWS